MIATISARFVAARVENIDATIQQALADIGAFFGADRSYIFEFSDNHQIADNTFEWCAPNVPAEIENLKNLPMAMYGEWIHQWRKGISIPVRDVLELPADSPERALLEPQGMRSVIMVPLPGEEDLQGIFGFDIMDAPFDWKEEHIALLQVIGEIIASAIQRKRADEFFRLRQLISRIAVNFINLPTSQVDDTVRSALTQIRQFLRLTSVDVIRPVPRSLKAERRALLAKLRRHNHLLSTTHELGMETPSDQPALVILLRHSNQELGVLIATHESRRSFEQADIRDSLQLVTDLIAGTFVRKTTEQKVEFLAYYDELTELPNRSLLSSRIERAVQLSADEPNCCALLFLDFDHFKRINDSVGREAGDLLLLEISKRLRKVISEGDVLARVGGDQFAILVESDGIWGDESLLRIRNIAETVRMEMVRPFRLKGQTFHGSASLGIVHLNPEETPSSLLKKAELAMYRAKAQGRNSFQFYDPEMQKQALERAQLYTDLRAAIADRQFEVYYQAQVNAAKEVIGAEALVRWNHPQRGLLSPAYFIQFAEETGLIGQIGMLVLEKACLEIKKLEKLGYSLPVAVNISANHILQEDFVDSVANLTKSMAIEPHMLKLEITESAMIQDTETVVQRMRALISMGFRFSLDDFGTGYSSLSYLKLFPIHEIKLDMRFVQDMLQSKEDAAIAELVFSLAKVLKLEVIAEGVSEVSQYEFLRELGCERFQGYLFSKPVARRDFEALVVQGSRHNVSLKG